MRRFPADSPAPSDVFSSPWSPSRYRTPEKSPLVAEEEDLEPEPEPEAAAVAEELPHGNLSETERGAASPASCRAPDFSGYVGGRQESLSLQAADGDWTPAAESLLERGDRQRVCCMPQFHTQLNSVLGLVPFNLLVILIYCCCRLPPRKHPPTVDLSGTSSSSSSTSRIQHVRCCCPRNRPTNSHGSWQPNWPTRSAMGKRDSWSC